MAEQPRQTNDENAAPANGSSASRSDGTAAPAEELDALRARLAAAEQARDQYLSLAQRTKAEFENYQKRNQRDLAQERRYAQAPLAADLLPALDNLERAIAAAQQAGEKGPLAEGVALIHAQFLDALRRHGVTRIAAEGQPFDPNQQHALGQQPTGDSPPMTVLHVLQPGYVLHDRVLRPAGVVVAAPATNGAGQPGA
jgi:molecular chaperone GrpE